MELVNQLNICIIIMLIMLKLNYNKINQLIKLQNYTTKYWKLKEIHHHDLF